MIAVAKENKLPQTHPKNIKDEQVTKVPHHQNIDSIKLTRQGKLILTTKYTNSAQKFLGLTTLFGVPISVYVEIETITSRFLLRIDPFVSCTEIANELSAKGFTIFEVRRFMRKAPSGLEPTSSVLITCVRTSLPQEVKLWYQVFRNLNLCG